MYVHCFTKRKMVLKMSLPISEDILLEILGFLSYLFSLMIGSMISGVVVTIDKNGRIRDSHNRFISFWRGFVFVILDLIVCSGLATFASGALRTFLFTNIMLIPAIVSGMFLAFLIWFCHSLSYKIEKHWKALAILSLIIIVNIVLVYPK